MKVSWAIAFSNRDGHAGLSPKGFGHWTARAALPGTWTCDVGRAAR